MWMKNKDYFGRPDLFTFSRTSYLVLGLVMKSNLEDTEWKDIHYFRVFPFLIVVADSSAHRHSASEKTITF